MNCEGSPNLSRNLIVLLCIHQKWNEPKGYGGHFEHQTKGHLELGSLRAPKIGSLRASATNLPFGVGRLGSPQHRHDMHPIHLTLVSNFGGVGQMGVFKSREHRKPKMSKRYDESSMFQSSRNRKTQSFEPMESPICEPTAFT